MEEKNESCLCNVIHKNVVEEVREKLPQEEMLYELAEFFKVFGDTTRIRILCALFEAEMCVCDLSALLNISQSAISHQLRGLKSARIVKFRREGKVVYYSLDDEHIKHIFDEGFRHISE
ncbi:helix-turn-helix transcriptional regulator [Clostridium sp. NSJ-6]|uniref:Helix-turn-helix transcriptional regulator n=1 Tax=Clostridium hominis TaxID=2763036 RepID=A0ABR7DHZ7_9CLOT|nr:metalloregulator ArsR/SmtB family transcription factor [Clostridium hominis]MBC5631011.1 helix-turn-helix transcriptional regulator [Clostridium hominis]MDU2673657.1 metalloregulator ArsR/SmtB family transcription factor [Clostridium sp.]